ncbi:putative RadC family protein [Candidatus Fokinia solitaria]|uniref:Putative RadC family protein n=1 Tax=Candidatus Fokinia solitaria TaxID=1802984 RepID=A0A2U8BSW5_9RICK|nr:JAB domain-containing protein [Candidatus Fokinia solitaria]AWD33432.1 putative RadC family protein [Candidatus Fokinia solitaria]
MIRKKDSQIDLKAYFSSMTDVELLAYVCKYVARRDQGEVIAKQLLSYFDNLTSIVHGYYLPYRGEINEKVEFFMSLLSNVFFRFISPKGLIGLYVSKDINQLVEYCRITMSFAPRESMYIFHLDAKNIIIDEDVVGIGTTDRVPVYPKELAKLAAWKKASSLIVVHNHVSENPYPSSADIEVTNVIEEHLRRANIKLFDHLIITKSLYYSMKNRNCCKISHDFLHVRGKSSVYKEKCKR